jgi:hypothetical protein
MLQLSDYWGVWLRGDCGWKKYGYNIAFKNQILKNQTSFKGNGAMVMDT